MLIDEWLRIPLADISAFPADARKSSMHVVDTHVTNCDLREESVMWGASFALLLPAPT